MARREEYELGLAAGIGGEVPDDNGQALWGLGEAFKFAAKVMGRQVPMKFAYADPPYLGCGKLYAEHHPDALDWDSPETHRQLVQRLQDEYPDGWALSLSTPSLRILAPMMPEDIRWASWSKPFAVFKPNVNPAYTWEPVAFRGGRKRDRTKDTVKDHHIEVITLRRGMPGAKPPGFAAWIPQLLGADVRQGDTIIDLFHGSGAMLGVWRAA